MKWLKHSDVYGNLLNEKKKWQKKSSRGLNNLQKSGKSQKNLESL